MKSGLKIIIPIVIVLFVGAVVVLNLKAKEPSEEVETEVVALRPMLQTVAATGELKAQSQVSVQPQIIGRVVKLHVREGDIVRKGEVVCELDRANFETAVEMARIAVLQLERTFARTDSLYRQKLISQEAYEQVKLQYDNANAQLRQAADQLDKTTILAPVSGRVVQLNVQEGEMAIAGMTNISGSVMMVIADLSTMLALVEASETDVPFIKPGQKARMTLDAFPDTAFAATVNRVGYMPIQTMLTATEKSTNFQVELKVDQPTAAMRPGMSTTVDITTSQRDSVLSVPIHSLGRRKIRNVESQTVFVVKGGLAKLTPVKTGISSDTDTEITDGVGIGDTVVTGPYKALSKLKDGARVHSKKETGDQPGSGKSRGQSDTTGR